MNRRTFVKLSLGMLTPSLALAASSAVAAEGRRAAIACDLEPCAAAAITSSDPGYVVAGVDDLGIRADIASAGGTAYFQAQAALAAHLALHPEDEGQLQIVPLHEVAA